MRSARPAPSPGTGIGAPTPFNFEIGPHRRFAMVRASLTDLKQVKNEFGGTVNDVILAAVAGALGRYMRARGHPTVGLELRAMVPVSVRTEEERGALGNRVTAMMAPLPVWCEDPVERLERSSESMGDLKDSKQAIGASLLTQLARLRAADDLGAGRPPPVAPALLQPRGHQRPRPPVPALPDGRRMERVFPMVPWRRTRGSASG